MNNKIPNIALVGNAPKEKHALLNEMLGEEDLKDICTISLYGADGQPEQEALRDAIDDWHNGDIQGIVCLPMALAPKKIIREQLPEEAENAHLLHINDAIVLSSVKGDVNANDIATSLKQEDIIAKVEQVAKALKRDLSILNPRIAVLSHSKEVGTDEQSLEAGIIAPAVSESTTKGTQAFGPLSYATFFEGNDHKAYDAVVELYDKQCLKEHEMASNSETIALVSNVNIPMAFAQPEGIMKAIYTVIDAERNRNRYDKPFNNPLPKLYHERKEDGDKARFAIKKKGFNPAEHRRENITFTTTRPASAPAAQGQQPAANNTASAE